MAASSCIVKPGNIGPMKWVDFTFTCSSVDGSFTTVTSSPYNLEGQLICIDTWPGTTAPTDNTAVTLTLSDAHGGVDIMGTTAVTVDATSKLRFISSVSHSPLIGLLNLAIASNIVHSATGTIRVWYNSLNFSMLTL